MKSNNNFMKILILITTLLTAPMSSLASDSAEPILTKYSTAGARPPKYRNNRKVEVFADGKVHVSSTQGLKSSEYDKTPLSDEVMAKIKECKTKVKKEKGVEFPNCAGSSSTAYYIGSKRISVRSCGELATIDLVCVRSMIKLLDNL